MGINTDQFSLIAKVVAKTLASDKDHRPCPVSVVPCSKSLSAEEINASVCTFLTDFGVHCILLGDRGLESFVETNFKAVSSGQRATNTFTSMASCSASVANSLSTLGKPIALMIDGRTIRSKHRKMFISHLINACLAIRTKLNFHIVLFGTNHSELSDFYETKILTTLDSAWTPIEFDLRVEEEADAQEHLTSLEIDNCEQQSKNIFLSPIPFIQREILDQYLLTLKQKQRDGSLIPIADILALIDPCTLAGLNSQAETLIRIGFSQVDLRSESYFRLVIRRARLMRHMSQIKEARREMSLVMSKLDDRSSSDVFREASAMQATLFLATGNFKACESLCQQALNTLITPTPELVQIKILIGHCHRVSGQIEKASSHYLQALEIARGLTYTDGVANSHESLGHSYALTNESKKAISHLMKARRAYESTGNVVGETSCRLSLAQIQFDQGLICECIEQLTAGIRALTTSGNLRSLFEFQLQLAKVKLFLGDRNEALAELRQTANLSHSLELPMVATDCHLTIALEELRSDNIADAQIHISLSRDYLKQISSTVLRRKVELFHLLLINADSDALDKTFQEIAQHGTAIDISESLIACTLIGVDTIKDRFLRDEGAMLAEQLPKRRLFELKAAFAAQRKKQSSKASFKALKKLGLSMIDNYEIRRVDRFLDYWFDVSKDKKDVIHTLSPVDSRKQSPSSNNEQPYDQWQSKLMKDFLQGLKAFYSSEATAIIEGPSGIGKSFLARQIHLNGPRRKQALVAVDCGTLNNDLFDTQLFGYVKGAFTGAHQDREGFFQAANGGTLLLDNIDELSLGCQAKLLRAIQEGEIRPVGATASQSVDVRIICTSQKEIEKLVEEGSFRSDLFYRLCVLHAQVPALSERPEDIEGYVKFLLKNAHINVNISRKCLSLLQTHPWPGNLRELTNEISRWLMMPSLGSTIKPEHLSKHVLNPPKVVNSRINVSKSDQGLDALLDSVEKETIQKFFEQFDGNIQRTARALGITRRRLRERLFKHGLYQN